MEGSQCLCRASHIHLCPHSCALGCAACPQNTWRQKRPGVTEGDEVHSQNRKSQTGLRVSHCLGLPCTLFRVWDEGTVSGPARHFPLGIHLSCLRDMNSRGSPDPLCSPQFTAPQHGAGPHEHLALVRMNSWVWKEKPPGQENSCLSFPDLHTGLGPKPRHPAANYLGSATCWKAQVVHLVGTFLKNWGRKVLMPGAPSLCSSPQGDS